MKIAIIRSFVSPFLSDSGIERIKQAKLKNGIEITIRKDYFENAGFYCHSKEEKIEALKIARTDKEVIDILLNEDAFDFFDFFGLANGTDRIEIHEIPDDVSDWIIEEYDGLEKIIYVENGKIKFNGEKIKEIIFSEDVKKERCAI